MEKAGCTSPAGSGEAFLAVRIVILNHVQNLQIHAVRASFHIVFSVGSRLYRTAG